VGGQLVNDDEIVSMFVGQSELLYLAGNPTPYYRSTPTFGLLDNNFVNELIAYQSRLSSTKTNLICK